MLSPADAALASRDRSLPGLAVALDGGRVREALAAASGDPAVSARATYVRYKPGTSCLVAYRVRCRGQVFDVAVKAHRPGDPKAAKTLEKVVRPPGARVCAGWVTEDVVFVGLPHDRRLDLAAWLCSPHARDALLARLVPGAQGRLRLVTLRYKPERRYVARVDDPDGPVALLKCYARPPSRVDVTASAVATGAGRLRLATRLGRSRRHRVVTYGWIDGKVLCPLTGDRTLLERTGAALREFHALTPPGEFADGRRPLPHLLDAAVGAVAALEPRWRTTAAATADRVRRVWREPAPAWGTIHGDFSADQVLVTAEPAISIVDYDEVRGGDPCTDLARFRAAGLARALATGTSVAHAETGFTALAAGYGLSAVWRRRVDLLTAAHLLALAAEPFRHRAPDWPSHTRALLAAAAERSA